MTKSFFEEPILNSPYEEPSRHHQLDEKGQPLNLPPKDERRRSELISPVPAAKKQKKRAKEVDLFDDGGEDAEIQTTVGKLWHAAADYGGIVGRVHYLDFKHAFATNGHERIFCNRASLRHENEVRLVVPNDDEQPLQNILLSCDLDALVDQVVISPFAPAWFAATVADIIEKYDYNFKMRQSELMSEPFY